MIKSIYAVFLLLFATNLYAQNYKSFHCYLGVGAGTKVDRIVYSYSIEPSFRLNDNFTVSLMGEVGASFYHSRSDLARQLGMGKHYSITTNARYYFYDKAVRIYAGLGLGAWNKTFVTVGDFGLGGDQSVKYGFYPRLGFDIEQLNINLDLNLIQPTAFKILNIGGQTSLVQLSNSYLSCRIGVYIFGGRRNTP